MPIRRDLRHHYRGAAWQATRRRILARAGGRFDKHGKYRGGAKCECCGRPDRRYVYVLYGEPVGWPPPDQLWSLHRGYLSQLWRSSALWGRVLRGLRLSREEWAHARRVLVQIGVAHINGKSGDDRDGNLAAWCRWCHLFHDRQQHHETRGTRKDRGRPMLQEASL